MLYREIAGTTVPALGFGTFQLSGDRCRRQVALAIETGYRLLDTARGYGNEALVGAGIAASGIDRKEIFLTSKIWREDLSPEGVFREAEGSLAELKTDYLDLLLIHWPNSAYPLGKTLEALVRLREERKIRHLGVSNFPPSLFRKACSLAPVFTNQVEYHPLLGQGPLLEIAREHGAAITAYSPLGQGAVFAEALLERIGKAHGKNPGQVALRWLLQQDGVIAIPRSSKPEHLRSNFNLFDFELTQEEMARIDRLPKDQRRVNPAFAPDWEV
jgi:2,5-diketo-D-gluconate reductase B